MLNEIFDNYETFYNMVLSTTIMCNTPTKEFVEDGKKIVYFIGKAYKVPNNFTKTCSDIIFGDLSRLGRTSDRDIIYSSRNLYDEYSDRDSLYDIKGDVLNTIQNLFDNTPMTNKGWFNYGHYKTYQAEVRYYKINTSSIYGNVITTRQTGILNALGIGCKTDLEKAILKFKQCALWSDIPSMYYLACVYSILNDDKNSKIYYDLADLCSKYLKEGITVIPQKIKNNYTEEALTYYVYISSILQDIIHTHKIVDIDFSFVEAINSKNLDYYTIMNYINNYESKAWRELTNSSNKPKTKLGF